MSMEADPLFKTLTEYEGVGIILEWNSGLRIVGETDHGLADDDPVYVEYYATAFQVNHILSHLILLLAKAVYIIG